MGIRIYLPPGEIGKKTGIGLPEEKARYLLTVLRCERGGRLEVIDGQGRAYEAEISAASKRGVAVDIIGELSVETESPFRLVLCQGILKGERMDLVIQKSTELGVREIIPMVTERSVVRETRKTGRWQRIAEEAAEQCGRAVIPRIHEPVEFLRFMAGSGSGVQGPGDIAAPLTPHPLQGLVFWEGGGAGLNEALAAALHDSALPFHLIVGPEGGLTEEEVKAAEGHGLVRASLGKRILRAETAAIVSVSLAQFLLEGRDLV
ncbi:MAG: 16S rRNA (uracil(1498)-N(3))-methyltransferase [Thermodesulfovibrionales bacterium]|jgi:16S rRNA (uracil1498-N3)-methyltransferase